MFDGGIYPALRLRSWRYLQFQSCSDSNLRIKRAVPLLHNRRGVVFVGQFFGNDAEIAERIGAVGILVMHRSARLLRALVNRALVPFQALNQPPGLGLVENGLLDRHSSGFNARLDGEVRR